jgi:CheY-like chemotaxis protein
MLPESVSSSSRTHRIVVIEASVDLACVLQKLLELQGHEVRRATNGIEGVELVISMRPDVVLSAIELPGIDGYEVARQIRRRGPVQPLLIATTSYSKERIGEKLKVAGFDLYLAKPVSRELLSTALRVRDGEPPHEDLWL